MSTALYPHLFQEELYRVSPSTIVILSRAWEDYSAEEKELLSKILRSVRLSLSGVRIISSPSVNPETLAIQSPSGVLIFGADTTQEIPFYKNTEREQFSVIRAHDLRDLDDIRKKELWMALKQMFRI